MTIGWIAILALTAADPALGAGRATHAPSFWAVVVGIEDYERPEFGRRPFARSDAAAIYDRLIAPDCVGASANRVWLLSDRPDEARKAQLATANNLRQALRTLARQVQPDDTVLLWFGGLGLPSGDDFRWLAVDADPARFAHTSILFAELRELLDEVNSLWTLLFSDLSFQPGEGLAMRGAVADAHWMRLYRGLAAPNRLVFSPTAGKLPGPIDTGQRQGRFAAALIAGLEGQADTEGGEPDGWITAAELWNFMKARLTNAARQSGNPPPSELPMLFGAERAPRLRLARHPAAEQSVNQQLDGLAAQRRADAIDDDLFADGVMLLSAMPRSSAERSLRAAYQQFLAGKLDRTKLAARHAEVVSQRRLSPEEARDFTGALRHARKLVDDHYIQPNQGAPTAAAGLRALLREADEAVPAILQKRADEIARLSETELASLAMAVRIKIGRRDDLPAAKAEEISLAAMLRSLDPYSKYFNESAFREYQIESSGHFAGVGVIVAQDPKTELLTVVTPILGSPAFKAGVWTGDRIVSIDGRPTRGTPLDAAARMLSGKKGQKVGLLVEREGHPEPLALKIAGEDVKVESVVGIRRLPDYSWDYWAEKSGRIGYLRLTTFAGDTADSLGKMVRRLRRDGMEGLVLDLRSNPGGLLTAAIDVADLFLDQGVIVTIKDRKGKSNVNRASRWGTISDLPLAVLINRYSASGSEIVAAAIADHNRGVLVGERSFGKGSVQNIYSGDEGSALKLTVATFHRPNGHNLHRFPRNTDADEWGVTPEPALRVAMTREEVEALERRMRAQEVLHRPDHVPAPVDAHDPPLEKAVGYLLQSKRSK